MKYKYIYLTTTLILAFLGLIMIYSSSCIWAKYKTGNEYYYLIRQGIFLILGIIVMIVTMKIPFEKWYKHANKLLVISLLSLILVILPGIGIVRGGARSWIGLGELSIQPSEIAKVGLIIFTAKFLANNPGIMKKNKYFYLYMLLIGIAFGLIMLQPDFGSGIILAASIIFMLFVDGIQFKNIILGLLACIVGMAVIILIAPYRMNRIKAFIDPWSDPLGTGFQTIQSLYAIAPSSLFGYGLFNSIQKYFYLPEPQTDFIFAILVEELGIIGGLFVLFLFIILIYIGYKMAFNTKSLFCGYVLIGTTSLILIQSFVNIGVVIGLIPVTGVTLPFFSYGGSSLIVNFFMIGINLNIISNASINTSYNNL